MKRRHLPLIAIADNDPDDQLLLKNALEECRPDLTIHFFENGEDLLRFLHRKDIGSEEQGAADLIIIDLYLPGKNAFELIEEIKGSPGLKRLPLIVLTCSPTDSDIKRCYELGANTVITKPSPFRELAEVLRTVCNYWFGSVRM